MALQTPRLVMVGLNSLNDAPPDALQPKLRDGVHLRWAFPRELGFPWYGFQLFGRDHLSPELSCREALQELAGRVPAAANPGAAVVICTSVSEALP